MRVAFLDVMALVSLAWQVGVSSKLSPRSSMTVMRGNLDFVSIVD